ncbi:Protein CBG26656 [Caenorhabditis briggsae]|uniref:Protein CBG26656 n=1 Tax=Caenorhabditis briggsae TaxID=6238 RepID=B6IE16_CAEBR|nr:Protein CBG26656 [Caenorhabditis briggsae]CAS01080.1 Protein CBG26656 [Caenorhabditis briggsae]
MKIEEEILQLMNYVPERTKNATSPMNLAQICRNFDAKFQPCLTLSCINKRDKENVPAEKSARKSEISEELSLKEFLRSLLLPIRALKSPMMTRVEFRIEAICFEEGSDDKEIPMINARSALEAIIDAVINV